MNFTIQKETQNHYLGPPKRIHNAFEKILKELGIDDAQIQLEHPMIEEHGDYASNVAMTTFLKIKNQPFDKVYPESRRGTQGKRSKIKDPKNPREFAQVIVDSLLNNKSLSDIVLYISVAGPGFINFKLKPEYLAQELTSIITQSQKYGTNDMGKGLKVALEHTNVNPNKALHIGHLRNACIGQAIERLWEACGYDVEVQYYVDDTGEQVAGTVLALKTLNIKPQEGVKFDHFSWDMYAKISELFETEPEIVQKKQEILRAIEEGDNEIARFTKEVANRILRDNLTTCHWYGFDYDVLIWEGDVLRRGLWKKAFEILKKSPAFALETEGKNKGAYVIKDEATGGSLGGDKVIVRSNGTVIYAGKDIAYHMWKFNLLGIDFNYNYFPDAPQKKPLYTTVSGDGIGNPGIGDADIVLDVVDLRQSFTLGAVKVALNALGYPKESANMHHIAYGVVFLSEGSMRLMGFQTEEGKKIYAMAGRKGIGIMADTLLDKVKLQVEKLFPESADIAEVVAVAGIKYGMLKYNTYSDIVFDLDHALSLQGDSGPYLQYTHARAHSVLSNSKLKTQSSKPNLKSQNFQLPTSNFQLNSEERAILRWLYRFPEVVAEAATTFGPNLLCNYLYELAQRFNTFYQKHRILKADTQVQKQLRLQLTASVAQVLQNGLYLLGIHALEKM